MTLRSRSEKRDDVSPLHPGGVDGGRSTITGAALRVNGSTNVIVRNLTLRATDCFPAWDPTDGDEGN